VGTDRQGGCLEGRGKALKQELKPHLPQDPKDAPTIESLSHL
jgi:hypothetical protein